MQKQLIAFFKNPVYIPDENKEFDYRMGIFWKLLLYCLICSIVFGILIGAVKMAIGLDTGQHALDSFMEKYSPIVLFLAAVVAAPVLEEFIFRAPMVFFKNNPRFKIAFYLFTLVFGFYHITNFEINTSVLLLSPLLVAPQLSVGLFLGFIRVRFGIRWAIALHAAYNFILIGPFVVLQFFDIPGS